MVEVKERQISAGLNELEKTFQEYKKKLEYTEQEAQQIIDLAREKADTIFKENGIKAQKMADEMRQTAKVEAEKIIAEAQAKRAEAETMIKEQTSKAQKIVEEMTLVAKNEASASKYKKNDSDNFKGQTKLVVLPPYNEVQTKELIELLKQIPGIKIDGTSAMEDNFLISLRIVEAIPLKRILSSISLVESSEVRDNIIKLKLKRYKIGGLPYY